MKYKMTLTKLRALLEAFVAAGGQGLEVLTGYQDAQRIDALADLAHRYDLYASAGSDFHRPGQPWAELGRVAALPDRCVLYGRSGHEGRIERIAPNPGRRRPYDVVVIGAGASGLMCAIHAGRRGLKVLVLEKGPKPGLKILVSGGGRCNFTNMWAEPTNHYLSANEHFCISAMRRYSPWDFIDMVNAHGIDYHEKSLASCSVITAPKTLSTCCWRKRRRRG